MNSEHFKYKNILIIDTDQINQRETEHVDYSSDIDTNQNNQEGTVYNPDIAKDQNDQRETEQVDYSPDMKCKQSISN